MAPATVQAAAPDPAPGVEASTGAAGSADGPPQTAPALGLAGARPYHPGATSRADAALAPDGGGVPGHAWEGTARRGGESDPGAPPASLAPPGPADAPVSLVRDVSVDTGGGVRPAATAVHASRADLGAIPGPAASGAVLHADGTGEAVWQGRLDAGPLGPLTVRVAVHAQAVHAHLEALPDAVPTLRLTAPALAEALRTDGLLLAQFSVRADAGRGDFPATSDGRRGAAGGEKRTIEAVAGVVPAAHAAGRGAAHGAGLCEWRM
ncbi:MAG: hypothetical protein IRZ11_06405 [Clostridia bacterium]|nr:hypothetical protein [Clostridia bacterium]